MGFFQGLGKAFKGMDMQKLSNGFGMARATINDDPEERQRLMGLMMQQRRQQQPQQPAQPGFGAVLPSHRFNPQQTPAYQPPGFGAVLPSNQWAPLGNAPLYRRGMY